MTMTEFVGSLGSKSCESQAKNTSALIVRVNNVAVSKQEANNAPMTLVRPLAMPIVFANTAFPQQVRSHAYAAYRVQNHFHHYKQWIG